MCEKNENLVPGMKKKIYEKKKIETQFEKTFGDITSKKWLSNPLLFLSRLSIFSYQLAENPAHFIVRNVRHDCELSLWKTGVKMT